ncbi:hypothetical protein ABK040_011376 [Willaertia magna]
MSLERLHSTEEKLNQIAEQALGDEDDENKIHHYPSGELRMVEDLSTTIKTNTTIKKQDTMNETPIIENEITLTNFSDPNQLHAFLRNNEKFIKRKQLYWDIFGGGYILMFFYFISLGIWFLIGCGILSLPFCLHLLKIIKLFKFPFSERDLLYFIIKSSMKQNDKHIKLKEEEGNIKNMPNSIYYQKEEMLLNQLTMTLTQLKNLIYVREKNNIFLLILNILWFITCGWLLCLIQLIFILILTCSIIGIDFAKRHLVLLPLTIMPFGVFIRI